MELMMKNNDDESIRIFCEATRQSTDIPIARPVTFHGRWGSSESGTTTMHGTRDSVVVSGTRENADGTVCNLDRSMLSKLSEKVINYLRKFAR